jgi:hypothetical protein
VPDPESTVSADLQRNEAVVREMIRHEDDLIHHRMTWLSTLNGLFITALGFAWGKPGTKPLVYVICVLGALASVTIGIALLSASRAVGRLKEWWDDYSKGKGYTGPGVMGLPHYTAGPLRYSAGWVSFQDALPWGLLVAWGAILFLAIKT